jgi:CspA family cold shock protein
MSESYHGEIRWFHEGRGYGFIWCRELGVDLFVHRNSFVSDGYTLPHPGAAVTFRIKSTQKGKQAVDAILSKAY